MAGGVPPARKKMTLFTVMVWAFRPGGDTDPEYVTMTVLPNGTFTGSAENVPNANVGRVTYSGSVSPPGLNAQNITVNSVIFFRAGGSANCVAALTRQP